MIFMYQFLASIILSSSPAVTVFFHTCMSYITCNNDKNIEIVLLFFSLFFLAGVRNVNCVNNISLYSFLVLKTIAESIFSIKSVACARLKVAIFEMHLCVTGRVKAGLPLLCCCSWLPSPQEEVLKESYSSSLILSTNTPSGYTWFGAQNVSQSWV